jgi:hypothetical protein
MTLEDLEHIFQNQIEEGTEKLYFMLVDGGEAMSVIERHPASDLSGLLPMLSSFEYAGGTANMPRFVK